MLPVGLADLDRSGIDETAASYAGMYTEDSGLSVDPSFRDEPVLVIPYLDPETGEFMRATDGEPFYRVRYLSKTGPRNFKGKLPPKYGQRSGSGVQAYFPRVEAFEWSEVLSNTDHPIVITEGEKKALRACMAGVPTIGLGGVFNFLEEGRLIACLDSTRWKGRDVYINFDSDAKTNPNIQLAESVLSEELGLTRRAHLRLVRLPFRSGGGKSGIDDFIQDYGEDAWIEELEDAVELRKIDSAVMALNQHVAWVEAEGMVYEFETAGWIQKNNFVNGSKYSTRKIMVPKASGDGLKEIIVATEWLRHELAQRYDDTVMNPSSNERLIEKDGKRMLNIWKPLPSKPGPVEPFLELTEMMAEGAPEDQRDFLLKLMAYKVQNPGTKIPIAPVLIGDEGTGKSLWARTMREVFGSYGRALDSSQLTSDFNGWVESAILAVIDEAKAIDVSKGGPRLRSLISDATQPLNEKYRAVRQVYSPTMYILTSNERDVGSFSGDNRRMYVLECVATRPKEWYTDYYVPWLDGDGVVYLRHYLQNYNLQGWTPPARAPMTAEKALAHSEGLTPVQQTAEDMKTATESIVVQWLDAANSWAEMMELSGQPGQSKTAREVVSAIKTMPVRPWYTADELMKMFPALMDSLYGNKRGGPASAGELSRQLRSCGIRHLINTDDPRGFTWQGRTRQYLIIADMDDTPRKISQNEFERRMNSFSSYADYKRR